MQHINNVTQSSQLFVPPLPLLGHAFWNLRIAAKSTRLLPTPPTPRSIPLQKCYWAGNWSRCRGDKGGAREWAAMFQSPQGDVGHCHPGPHGGWTLSPPRSHVTCGCVCS